MEHEGGRIRIEDKDLLAYLDGEAGSEIVARIEASEEHLKRARELEQVQNRLKARLFRAACPDTVQLGEYHLGLLDGKQTKEIKQHIAECPHCRRELIQLEVFLQQEKRQDSPQSEAGLQVRIARLLKDIKQGLSPGELAYQPAYASLRGGSQGPITLEADGILLLLDLQPAGEGKVSLLGQVVADNLDQWTSAAVEISQAGSLVLATRLDDLGAFRAERLSPGLSELTITPDDGPAILAKVDVTG